MVSINSLISRKIVDTTGDGSATTTPSVKSSSADFETILKKLLPTSSGNKVSEEELFAGVTRERILANKSEEAAAKYDEVFASIKSRLTKGDGYIPYEQITNATLKKLTSSGVLTKDEANKVYSEAFAGSQLDNNTSALWDSIGGGKDVTIAISTMEAALQRAKLKLDNLASGKDTLAERDLFTGKQLSVGSTGLSDPTVITPNGRVFDNSGGFLFKPISHNEGRLAVLLPDSMAHLVDKVVIKNENGKVIDTGRSTGYGDAGVQEKFSFSRKGGNYPKNITVEVRMSDGTVTSYKIPDPSKRYD